MRMIRGFRWRSPTNPYDFDDGVGVLFHPEMSLHDPEGSIRLVRTEQGDVTFFSLLRGDTVMFRHAVPSREVDPDQVAMIVEEVQDALEDRAIPPSRLTVR